MSDSSLPAKDSTDEVEALRIRNAELEQQIAATKQRHGWRMYTALGLVVLFCIGLVPANQSLWFATTALETDNFVSTFAPLPEDPAVAAAIGAEIAASVSEQAALDERIAGRLPDDLQFIAVPVAGAVETVIAEAATRIVSSDQFGTIWEETLTAAHSAAIRIVEGADSGAVQLEGDQVVLDLNELVVRVDNQLKERGIDVLNPDDIDATIVLYQSDELGLVDTIIRAIYTVRWAAPIAVLILLIGAVLIGTDRRKVTIWLGIATIVAMALTLIEIRFIRNNVIESIADDVLADGASAAWNIVFDRLLAQTWGLLALGLVASLVAWFFGPSERSGSLRTSFVNARNSARGDAELTPTTKFIHTHRRAIEWVTVALGALVLLMAPTVRGWLVIVVAVLVIGVIAAVEWIAGTGSQADTADDAEQANARSESASLDV